jgi:hypothetical protein
MKAATSGRSSKPSSGRSSQLRKLGTEEAGGQVRSGVAALALLALASAAHAQTFEQRGFVEGQVWAFPQEALNDPTQVIGDALAREEVFVNAARWLELAAGFDFRANSHDQVEDSWDLNFDDRTVLRPRLAVRRLAATIRAGALTVDVGKQFIRWGRADIVNPTDRFAPEDFLNVIDTEFLPVLAVRPVVQMGSETIEFVWTPEMTPSRAPLLDQRWAVVDPALQGIAIVDAGAIFPDESQFGVRWRHAGRFDAGLSFFDGFNHLPTVQPRLLVDQGAVELTRTYPDLRTYGGEIAVPLAWFTLKGEAAYFESPSSTSEEYVLWVAEIERQVGEWVLAGGYIGEYVTTTRPDLAFSPERGVAKSIIAHVSYTVDPRQTVSIEGAVRQDLAGVYVKGEYSRAMGQHWRLTFTGVGIGGDEDDFLGQYERNSHGSATLRVSF